MENWICARCEAENDAEATICAVCGTKKDYRPEPVPDPQPIVHDAVPQQQTQPVKDKPSSSAGPFMDIRKEASSPAGHDDLRALIRKYDQQKLMFRVLICLFSALQYILFALRYALDPKEVFTIYRNLGRQGAELICSIILVIIAVLPAVLCWFNFRLRKRNLPITVSTFVTSLTTIYCLVIWIGCSPSTAVPAFIILSSLVVLLCTVLLVRTIDKLDNAMYRPRDF